MTIVIQFIFITWLESDLNFGLSSNSNFGFMVRVD